MMNMKQVKGISLIEVLITILVMAVGMLGVAALQVKALNTSQGSYSRAQAVALVEDLSDKMRSNYEFIHSGGAGNNAYTENNDGANGWCAAPPTACTSGCSQEQLALNDVNESCTALTNAGIPDSKLGVLCQDNDGADGDACSPGSSHVIFASWEPVSREDTDGTDTYVENSFCQTSIGLETYETCVYIQLVP